MSLSINPSITIPDWELRETFIRASGPGGQNVNKVASAVQLKFDTANSPSLSAAVKARLKSIAGRRMTKDGVLIIEAKRFRDQEKNRADARAPRRVDRTRRDPAKVASQDNRFAQPETQARGEQEKARGAEGRSQTPVNRLGLSKN